MKKYIFLVFAGILFLNSCQYYQSVDKDLKTGAYSRGDGIICDEVVLQINGKNENRNEFIYGEEVNILFENIKGFKRVDGKAFPEMTMYIIKNEKDTIHAEQDLLKDFKDGVETSPLELSSTFKALLPYRHQEKYKAVVNIKDAKGEGKFIYSLPFSIKPNKTLIIESNGIKYKDVYLWDKELEQFVVDNHLKAGRPYLLILENIEGLKLSDGKIFPAFSIKITDKEQHEILAEPNLLSELKEIGINPEDLANNHLSATIVLPSTKIKNPYKLTAILRDIISSKELKVEMDFILENE